VEAVAGKLVGRDILPQVAGGSQTALGTGLESVDAIVRLVGQRTVSGEPKPQESVGFPRCDSFAGGVEHGDKSDVFVHPSTFAQEYGMKTRAALRACHGNTKRRRWRFLRPVWQDGAPFAHEAAQLR
jgi:hypothetical protein